MQEQGYGALAKSLYSSDPRMRTSVLNSTPPLKGAWTPWSQLRDRAVVLHLGSSGSFEEPVEYTSASALAIALREQVTASRGPSRSVYLLEGLSQDFISVLGGHFRIHPSLFMDHERLVPAGGRLTGENGGIPFLPSASCGRDHVSLKYHEPLVLPTRPAGFRNLCDVSGRHIAMTRLVGQLSDVGISRRKCTFWSNETPSGGWSCTYYLKGKERPQNENIATRRNLSASAGNQLLTVKAVRVLTVTGLIICDPPVQRILTDYSGNFGYDVAASPYNSGYIDFVPLSHQMKMQCGPPRSSLLDDLLFYLKNHSDALETPIVPRSLRVFVDKIVASHFLKLAEFLQTNIDIVQWHLSRRHDLALFAVAAVEELWSDVQAWQRRTAEYQDDLEAIMLQLHIPLKGTEDIDGRIRSWTNSTADFQYLLRRYREIGRRTQGLADAISALGSLAGNRAMSRSADLSLQEAARAGREARSMKTLTTLGLLFLPLSFSASVFSMAESYLPGNSMFWVYFAVSLPLVAVVFLLSFIMELGYTEALRHWSLMWLMAHTKWRAGRREMNQGTDVESKQQSARH
ncbi:uncharacterized protein PG998_006442 [Apiospora kogelbergensis]|uniref:uncharacterized protein n=1 Tax=Apiospora kogelbergensis TaxID=1337665 RepID=UPI003132319C